MKKWFVLTGFARAFGVAILFSYLLFCQHKYGFAKAGFLSSILLIGRLASDNFKGILLDRFNARFIVLLFTFLFTGFVLSIFFVPNNIFLLGFIGFMMGFCEVPVLPAVMKHAHKYADEKVITQAQTYIMESSYMVGPLIGVLLSGFSPVYAIYIFAVVLFLLDFALVFAPCFRETPVRTSHKLSFRFAFPIPALLLAAFIWIFAYDLVVIGWQKMFLGSSYGLAGWCLTAIATGAVIGLKFYTRLGRFKQWELSIGFLAYGVLLLVQVFVHSPVLVLVVAFFSGVAYTPAQLRLYEMVREYSDEHRLAQTFTALTTVMTVGGSLGYVVSGFLVDVYSPSFSFVLACVVICLIAVYCFVVEKKTYVVKNI